jgi:hypothetical protein
VLGEAFDYLEKLWSDWILFKLFERALCGVLGKSLDHLENFCSAWIRYKSIGRALEGLKRLYFIWKSFGVLGYSLNHMGGEDHLGKNKRKNKIDGARKGEDHLGKNKMRGGHRL